MNLGELKRCTKCGDAQPAADFYRNRSRKDGLHDRCKTCWKEASEKAFTEKMARLQLEAWKTCKACGERLQCRNFYLSKSSSDGLELRCKACCAKKDSDWKKANPEYMAAARYRAKQSESYVSRNRARVSAWRSTDTGRKKKNKSSRRAREELRDTYVRERLRIPATQGPKYEQLIHQKREQLLLRRLSVSIKQALKKE